MNRRMVRIFVSSTFRDFEDERNALTACFQRLSELCKEEGFSFQVIDLRWGITEQDGLDNRTMKICLDEIRRCQEISPKPNFIGMAGLYYGWVPLPAEISPENWDLLTRDLDRNSTQYQLLSKWYQQDQNDLRKYYYLKSHAGLKAIWKQDEKKLYHLLTELADKNLSSKSIADLALGISATEQELILGLFSSNVKQKLDPPTQPGSAVEDHVLIMLKDHKSRQIQDYLQELKDTDRMTQEEIDQDEQNAKELQEHLKIFLQNCEEQQIISSKDTYVQHIEDFLTDLIQKQIQTVKEEEASLTPFQRELFQLDEQLKHISGSFQQIDEQFEQFTRSCNQYRGNVMLLTGPSGSGKSTLLKQWFSTHREESAGVFADIQPFCSSILHALHFCAEMLSVVSGYEFSETQINYDNALTWFKNQLGAIPKNKTITIDYDNVVTWFENQLAAIPKNKTITILLDSVETITDWKALQQSMLHIHIPAHVTLVISCISTDSFRADEHAEQLPSVSMKSLNNSSGIQMLQGLLAAQRRSLTKEQLLYLQKNIPSDTTPLYIQLLAEKYKAVHSFDKESTWMNLPGSIQEQMQTFIDNGENYGPAFLYILGCLAVSRDGLSEQELLEVLPHFGDTEKEKQNLAHSEWTKMENLQQGLGVLWARMHYTISPLLMETSSNGLLLLKYRHALIQSCITHILGDSLIENCKRKLADYFEEQPNLTAQKNNLHTANHRKSRELYVLRAQLGQWEGIGRLLEDPGYIDAFILLKQYRELMTQYQEYRQHHAFSPSQSRYHDLLLRKRTLLQIWPNSFSSVVAENANIYANTLATQTTCYFKKKTAEPSHADNDFWYLSGSASHAIALSGTKYIAVLAGKFIMIYDAESRIETGMRSYVGDVSAVLYWSGETLILRGEYQRMYFHIQNGELYADDEKTETCESWGAYTGDNLEIQRIRAAGGFEEADIFRSSIQPIFSYFYENRICPGEVYYDISLDIRIKFHGKYAAILTDHFRIDIVDLETRRILLQKICPLCTQIYWSSDGNAILICTERNMVQVLPVDLTVKGTPMPLPRYTGSAYEKYYKKAIIRKNLLDVLGIFTTPTWSGVIPQGLLNRNTQPLFTAMSKVGNWFACYYYYNSKSFIRLFRLTDQKLIAECNVDPIFSSEAGKQVLYPSPDGEKLYLVSRERTHCWNLKTKRWSISRENAPSTQDSSRDDPNVSADSLSVQQDSSKPSSDYDTVIQRILDNYQTIMRKWLPQPTKPTIAGSSRYISEKIMDKIFAGFEKIFPTFITLIGIPISTIISPEEIAKDQLINTPVICSGDHIWLVDRLHSMIHVCDRSGTWLCHLQTDAPFAAADVIDDKVYVMREDFSGVDVWELADGKSC